MSGRPLRVTALGFLGMGNLGNEASLAAFLAGLRAEVPEARVTCLSVEPEAVLRRHGVPGTTLMSYRAAPGDRGPVTAVRKVLGRVWDVPRMFSLVRRTDVVVVPGMGVLEASMAAHPWGLPYWQFLAALACRLERRRFLLLSVGAERAHHPVVRFYYAWTVRLADYCTFRDQGSVEAMRASGARGRPGTVVPDLAFSLPVPPAPGPVRPGHVVVGVMVFRGRPGSADTGDGQVASYVDRLSAALARLLRRGRTVTLVVGDVADFPTAHEIARRTRQLCPDVPGANLEVSAAEDFTGTVEEMQQAEVVIASRFHNVIAGLMAGRPTLTLGYAGKNQQLLAAHGLGAYAQPIGDFDVETLVTQVEGLATRTGVEDRINEELVTARAALSRQFAAVGRLVRPAGS